MMMKMPLTTDNRSRVLMIQVILNCKGGGYGGVKNKALKVEIPTTTNQPGTQIQV